MPRTPIHPGEHLAEELRQVGITAAELSRQIDVPVNRVTGIIHGQRGITADTALRLAHWFGTTPQFWMNLQQLYELRLAENSVGAEIENHSNFFVGLAVNDHLQDFEFALGQGGAALATQRCLLLNLGVEDGFSGGDFADRGAEF